MAWRLKTFVLLVALSPLLYVILFQQGLIYRTVQPLSSNGGGAMRLATIQPAPQVTTPRRVLLVTYGRSGSTFLSYILKEAPDAFFFFEPLRALLMGATRGMDVIMNYDAIGGKVFPPQELPVSNLTSYERQAIDVMSDLFNCDISKYPVTNYRSNHFRLHGDVSHVARCLWSMVNDTYLNLSDYLQCLLRFFFACQHAPLRVFKVIRLPVRSLFPLMRRFPDLQVVYLVRDPRAILWSQRRLFGHAPSPGDLCGMMGDDVRHLQLLQTSFPGRAVAVRYEDISSDPLQWTRRLYHALGLNLTSHVIQSVKKMTSSHSQKPADAYSAYRSDSKKAAENWRTQISPTEALKSEQACEDALRLLGYKKASSKEVLRDLHVSLVASDSQLPLL